MAAVAFGLLPEAVMLPVKLSCVPAARAGPVFALDIALHDGEYYVLEMGNFNSAGLYHCDIQKIVMAIHAMIEREA